MDCPFHKKPKLSHDESKDDVGLSASLHHNDDSDNISDITPPLENETVVQSSSNKRNVLDRLLSTLFSAKPLTKPLRIKYNASALNKIHPYEAQAKLCEIDDAQYRYLVNCTHRLIESINNRDLEGLESLINEVYRKDCILQNMALKEPVVGRHYTIEMFKSLMRCSNDLNFKIEGHHVENSYNGSIVITFYHYTRGKS